MDSRNINETFPIEIFILIFSDLGINDLGKVALVCKYWNLISNNNELWKKFIEKNKLLSFFANTPNKERVKVQQQYKKQQPLKDPKPKKEYKVIGRIPNPLFTLLHPTRTTNRETLTEQLAKPHK